MTYSQSGAESCQWGDAGRFEFYVAYADASTKRCYIPKFRYVPFYFCFFTIGSSLVCHRIGTRNSKKKSVEKYDEFMVKAVGRISLSRLIVVRI